MYKYSLEDKKKYIELMLSGEHSIRSAAKEAGVSKSAGERWWKRYNSLGFEGLIIKSKDYSLNYSLEFKLHAIKYKQDNHLSINQAAADLMISTSSLNRWEQIYLEEGEEGLSMNRRMLHKIMKSEESKKNLSIVKTQEELIAENERLRAEVAYLKKSIALAQEKRNLQGKKKQK